MVVAYYGTPHQGEDLSNRGPKKGVSAHINIFKRDHDPTKSSTTPYFSVSMDKAKVCLVRPGPSRSRRSSEGANILKRVVFNSSFSVTTNEGWSYEFKAQSEKECQIWVNKLKFLITFPYSCMPLEPKCDATLFDVTLQPWLYKAGTYDVFLVFPSWFKMST